ncbi:MAG: peptidylprolyl isomerase [Marinilabiliaceae bacterium]|nr:peptidylprolyl isomerase [Marinilabiliaceae bacterium]
MKISANKSVSIAYRLTLDGADGELIEETTSDKPLQFISGQGRMIAKFEQNLQGLSSGENFTIHLEAKDAYGEIEKDAIVEIPKEIFEVNGEIDENLLVIGNQIRLQDNSGNVMSGKVLEILDDKVKMDFNHPLAGKNLYFTGTVLEVRDATEEELSPPCSPHRCSSCASSCG